MLTYKTIFELLHNHGPLTAKEITHLVGHSRYSVIEFLQRMHKAGLLYQPERKRWAVTRVPGKDWKS
jgi:Mn-dependent DtxR family transcriptional regulator